MPETIHTKVNNLIKGNVKSKGGLYIKLHGHAMQMPGLPDSLIIHILYRGWVEIKILPDDLSIIQRKVISILRLYGDTVIVVYCDKDMGNVRLDNGTLSRNLKFEECKDWLKQFEALR